MHSSTELARFHKVTQAYVSLQNELQTAPVDILKSNIGAFVFHENPKNQLVSHSRDRFHNVIDAHNQKQTEENQLTQQDRLLLAQMWILGLTSVMSEFHARHTPLNFS